MGSVVLLLDDPEPNLGLGPEVVQALAALGITSVTVLRNDRITAVALEGWTFDVDRSAAAAARAVATETATVSILRPVLESSISRLDRPAPAPSEAG